MLISEEILRHLVTVLDQRGPIDELAPAAAARSLDDDGEPLTADLDADDIVDSAPAAISDDTNGVGGGEPAEVAPTAEPAPAAEPVAVADATDAQDTEERAEG
jgi:hypothetical protein